MKPADLIKNARKKKGWTQKQLADAVGVTSSFITQVEAGKTFPSYERCVALANVLNLPLDELWAQVEKARMEIFQKRISVRSETVRTAFRAGSAEAAPPAAPSASEEGSPLQTLAQIGRGELLKVVRWALQKLVYGESWQLIPGFELGTEGGAVSPSPSQRCILRLTSGPLEGAEVEYTSADRLVITLNRPAPEGSHLKLITETGEELQLPVLRPLDPVLGRAIYDFSGVSETPAFQLVLVEGEGEGVEK